MKKTRFTALAVAAAMSVSLFTGCGNTSKPEQTETPVQTTSAGSDDVQSGTVVVEANAMEESAASVTVAVDDDSFTIGPWGGASAVRDWTENVLWAHLVYRPFIGAMLNDGVQMVA